MAPAPKTPVPKPVPHAALSLNFLSGLSTDVPLSWLPRTANQCFMPPILTRALFSLLLRTSAPSESVAAQKALLHAQTLPQQSPAACLGFPSDAAPEFIRDVLQDLLLSASRGDPLLLSGKALKLYADAGPDADEYNNPTPDPRVPHASTQYPLAVIRVENLARAVVVFAHAFQETTSRQALLNIASHNMSCFLAPLEFLPDTIASLANPMREAIKLFYATYAAVATDQMRQELATRLTCSLMRLAKVDPSGISPYMRGMADPHIRLQACRMCLTQRYGVRDANISNPLNVETVLPYLKVKFHENRYNKAVPALLNSLLSSWYHTNDKDSFRFKGNPAEKSRCILGRLCNTRDNLSKFGAPQRDLNALSGTIAHIGSWITECNS